MRQRLSFIILVAFSSCALYALSAANASALELTTAYTCSQTASVKEFSRAHCAAADKPGSTWGHEVIAKNTLTEIEATSAKTSGGTTAGTTSKLEGTLAGFETAVTCTSVTGEGTMENKEDASGNMWAEGTGKFHYTGCSVTRPAGIGCVVNGNKVDTEELKGTTKGQTTGKLKFEMIGTRFANIKIEGCSKTALNNTFPIAGSFIANTDGATTTTTHSAITGQETLIFGGNEAGLEGAITIEKVGTSSSVQEAYTCAPSGGSKDYATADTHCVTNLGSGNGTRGHVAITGTTEIEGTSASTASGTTTSSPSTLEGTLAGFETAIECTGVSSSGSLTNEAPVVSGTGIIHYTSCSVKKPAGIGCKVKENKVDTEELKGTTKGLPAGELKFEMIGTRFANIKIEGCSKTALNNTFPVTGSLIAKTNGATTTTTRSETTGQETLIFGGNEAGLDNALTTSMSGSGDPITLYTVTTESGNPITLT